MRNTMLAAAVLAFAACATHPRDLPIAPAEVHVDTCDYSSERVRFQYLGAGGWTIRRAGDAIMTAPLFSNPSLLRVALFRVVPNQRRIETHLQRIRDLDTIDAVLVGHGHYDHLLDISVVMDRLSASVNLYGDDTTANTLASTLGSRAKSVLSSAGTINSPGKWIQVANVRFMPLVSEHAPHEHGLKFFRGHRQLRLDELPGRASGWREGEPVAYLIDFLSPEGVPEFRVYYDDAVHSYPYGYPDRMTLGERSVDVAILTVASFEQVDDYPERLVDWLQPRHVVLSHWEDFFRPPDEPIRAIRLTNVNKFLRHLKTRMPDQSTLTLPDRHTTITFGCTPEREISAQTH